MLGVRRVRAISNYVRAPSKKRVKRAPVMRIPRNSFMSMRDKAYKVTMVYAESITLNPGVSGNVVVNVFAANGLYDPDITGVGHQPARFDQLMSIYGEYVVVKSRIKVVFSNTNISSVSGTDLNGIVGITLNESPTAQTDWRRYIENGDAVWSNVSAVGGPCTTLTMPVDLRNWYRQDIYNDSDYAGNSTSNPPETLHYHVWARSVQGTDTAAFNAVVEIQYDCYFKEPINTNIS